MPTVYISIGNSDDKLSQARWSAFYEDVDEVIHHVSTQPPGGQPARIHGRWVSPSSAPWQNACWCLELGDQADDWLRERLIELARDYGQDSIAWAEVPRTEFLTPAGA